MNSIGLKTRLAAAAAMALALTACKDNGPRASDAAGLPLPVLDASMPYAPPAPVERYAPERGYRLAERAYGVQRAVYETRPDYAFDYGDEESLAWETADDWSMYAEPWDDGYRYYYYEPGASYPYFVRDDDYGYGYNGAGVLVAVVDTRGRYLPAEDFRRVAPVAGRYYVRGHDLRDAGLRGQRLRVDERAWTDRAPRVRRSADPWLSAARDDGDWRRWREADRNRELDRFTAEQVRRAQAQRTWVNGRDPAALRAQQDQAARDAEQRAQAQRAGFDGRARAEEQQRRAQQAQAEQRREVQQAQFDRQQRQAQQAQQVRAQQADRQGRERQAQALQRDQQQARAAEQQRRNTEQQQARAEHDRQGAERAQQAQRQQQARAAQRQQQQARAEHDRQGAERAQQDRAQQAQRQQQAQAAQREQQQARAQQQAERQQAQAQARSADQAARAAAAHERAQPNPQGKPHGKPDDRGDGKDRKD